MTLSPFEVERREFGRGPMGYRIRDVDDFLDEVHRSLGQLWQERSDMREENERLKERLQRFEQMEDQLKNTLLLAQDSAEKAHEQARRESDLLMREAGQKARDIVHVAHEDKQRLEMVLRDLHSAEQEARQRMRALSQTVLSHLDDTEQLVQDGATTLRAIVQAQPEISELRTGTTGQLARVDVSDVSGVDAREADPHWASDAESDAELQPVVPPHRSRRDREDATQGDDEHSDEPFTRSERAARMRHMATSEAADAFFDAPPTFDHTEVAPLEPTPRRSAGDVEPRSFADF